MTRTWSIGLAAILVVSGLSAACGSDDDGGASPAQACNDAAVTLCARLFECVDAATLALLGYTSQSQCVTKTQADEGCSAKTAENACTGSLKYHGDQAQKCISQFKGATCAEITGGDQETFAPACDLICTAE
jgi:hypothetical protein